jgi:hypothetical protein
MVIGRSYGHDRRMTALTTFMTTTAPPIDRAPSGGRDPARELYEHAAGLLATAQALEAATHTRGAVAAVGPTLACLETSLVALAGATERLRGHALERLTEPVLANDDLRAHRADIALQLGRLAGVLEQASLASAHARDSVEPMSSELTAI